MKQQTAMQQLLAYIRHNGQSWRGISADMIEREFIPLEKGQHGSTWDAAIKAHDDRGHVHARSIPDFDEYYTETYEQK